MEKTRNILICPLEWGLGHAGRMIALATRLRDMKYNVIIGSGDEHLALFQNELPELTSINFPGFRPSYSRFLPQYLSMLLQTPLLIYHSIREHHRLKKIIHDNSIDIVISDNRFGLWNRKVKCVYVTHMPLIPLPRSLFFLEFVGIMIHRAIIKKYSLCFIPDLPGELNISGRLTHGVRLPANTRFIGLLSRFSVHNLKPVIDNFKFAHNTIILSGPEPQRTMLKNILSQIFKDKEPVTIILGARPGRIADPAVRSGNIIYIDHLATAEMKELLTSSHLILTRSGYTSVMEIISLGCTAILIPTPGQTEQEYLAGYLEEKGWFTSQTQKSLKGGLLIKSAKRSIPEEMMDHSLELLDAALKELSD